MLEGFIYTGDLLLQLLHHFLSARDIFSLLGLLDRILDALNLTLLPFLVTRVELPEDEHKLVQNAHRERARADRWVEGFERVNSSYKSAHFRRGEFLRLAVVGE